MKTFMRFPPVVPLCFAGLLWAMGCLQTRAEDVIISTFDNSGGLSGWRFDYGGVTSSLEFDPADDAHALATSGSLKVTLGFDAATLNPSGNNKGAVTIDLPAALDGSTFVTMQMDLKVDEGSATDTAGNSGFFQMVIRNTGSYDFNSQFGASVNTSNGWLHISVPVSGAHGDIHAVTLELYGGAGITGPVVLHVDNVKFTKPDSFENVFVSQFDTSSALARWRFDYGGVTHAIEFASADAGGSASSGSMKVTLGFDAAALNPSGNNKGAVTIDLPSPIDASTFRSMEMDLKVAPESAIDAGFNSGYFQMVIRNTGNYDFNSQFGGSVSLNDGWRHIAVLPITGAANDIRAITLELYGGADITGPVILFVDNVKFTKAAAPPPSPSLRVERPVRGLNLIPTSGQYQRQSIATVESASLGWVGSADPVTYALTISQYPDSSHPGFQTHFFLVPGTPAAGSVPDYNEPNVIFLDIQGQADGTARAYFRYKINEPQGNTFLYGAGTLGSVTNSTPLGTWSVTMTGDTGVTVSTPGGGSGSFTLPAAAAALFAGGITVYVGDQPNSGPNVGQTAIISLVQIYRGSNILLDDNFVADDTLDMNAWKLAAGDANGVKLIGSTAAFWLSWTLPDTGFVLQSSADLTDPNSWAPTGWVVGQSGSVKRALISFPNPDPTSIVIPNPDLSFFRLVK